MNKIDKIIKKLQLEMKLRGVEKKDVDRILNTIEKEKYFRHPNTGNVILETTFELFFINSIEFSDPHVNTLDPRLAQMNNLKQKQNTGNT